MADSKFLKYQDTDGDRFPDICDDVLEEVADVSPCPKCIPNPYAITQDWKTQDSNTPFFDEKTCTFQLAVTTPYTETVDINMFPEVSNIAELSEAQVAEGMQARYDEFMSHASETFLIGYAKDSASEQIETLKEYITPAGYDLSVRENSKLKLLYTVDFEDFASMPDDPYQDQEEEEDEEEESEEQNSIAPVSATVVYDVDDLRAKIVRVRKGLRLYSKYLKVFRAIKKGNILFSENNSVFNLEKYGDDGAFNSTTLGSIVYYIDAFLNKRGLSIPMVGPVKLFNERVTKIEFQFANDYKISKMRVYVAGCGDAPRVFGKKKLKSLVENINRGVFRDPTAMAYFAQLDAMDQALQAREPTPWIDFVKEYTYPEVYDQISAVNQQEAPTGTCVTNALLEEGKQFGQDILDDAFSLGDAVAYAFRNRICMNEVEELQEFEAEIGLGYNVSDENLNAGLTASERLGGSSVDRLSGRAKNAAAMADLAKEQAYKTIQSNDTVLTSLCERMLGVVGQDEHKSFNLNDLFSDSLDNIKLCGLFNLLNESITCLLKNLTFEQAIGSIVRSALKGMSITNLEDLFIGLDADSRRRVNLLVQQKLQDGDVFEDSSVNQSISDNIENNNNVTLEGLAELSRQRNEADMAEEDIENPVGGGWSRAKNLGTQSISDNNLRTVGQQVDLVSNPSVSFNENTIIQAYSAAIVDVYSDNLLELVDRLNKYPGAQIIKRTLAFFDCPQDPIMDPNIADFIKSVQLPICRNTHDLVIPRLNSPFAWIPEISDWQGITFELGKLAIRQAVVNAMVKLILKVCELLSGSVCKTLQLGMSAIASLPDITTGRDNFKEMLRNNLCGQNASDEELDNSIDELLNGLGGPPNKFASEDELKDFVVDYSNALTQVELMSLTMGSATTDSLDIAMEMINSEYQNLIQNFPDRQAVSNFFSNVGNLFPADARDAIDDQLNNPPGSNSDTPSAPVNPSLCATPEQYEAFCEYRASLLSGRATPQQIKELCDNQRDGFLSDLQDLGDVAQDGMPTYLDTNMPPIASQPGCDDGVFPYESPEAIETAQNIISGEFEKLQIAYSTDMIGNGPFQRNYGLLNMVLSDTMGNPLSTHHRKTFLKRNYVDFYRDGGDDDYGKVSRIESQRGAYPQKIAEWLQQQLAGSSDADDLSNSVNYYSSNNWQVSKTSSVSVIDLGLSTFGRNPIGKNISMRPDIKYYNLPDFGYNTRIELNLFNGTTDPVLDIITEGRKKNPDLSLSFKDNARGLRSGDNNKLSAYSYGFDIDCYFADLSYSRPAFIASPDYRNNLLFPTSQANLTRDTIHNLRSDNIRVVVNELNNEGARKVSKWAPFTKKVLAPTGDTRNEEPAIAMRKYEMFVTEDTLQDFDFDTYPDFAKCFTEQNEYSPYVVLLKNIVDNYDFSIFGNLENTKSYHDAATNIIIKKIFEDVANNDVAFNYGAKFDSLTEEDLEYVLGPGYGVYSGGPYGEALIKDVETGEMRKIVNDDMILGMSRMQYEIEESGTYTGTATENRVFYLDPMSYGRNYMSPALYIKPEQNKGWLGLIDVLFPELNPCKPQVADFIDFSDISEIISSKYSSIPEDHRLESGGRDCVVELPYNRILDRTSTASLEGLITATVRIFCSVHMLKAFATFSKFKPNFPDLFSSIFAQHIVEEMEESLSDAQGNFGEMFTTFKDEEFYLAFLEQTVQMYGRKIDSGEILDVPPSVVSAITSINNSQEAYTYPSKKDLDIEKDSGVVPRIKTLKNYREDKKYNHIYITKDLAKVILKQVVVEELNKMGETLVNNMQAIDVKPDVSNMGHYFIENFAQGHTLSLAGSEFTETSEEFPTTTAEDLYTAGGEFSVYAVNDPNSSYELGDEYIGYYHIHVDEVGRVRYMTGEFHRDVPHDVIKPYAEKITISNLNTGMPLGDVGEWNVLNMPESLDTTDKPFLLEKYIKINNIFYSPSEAVDIILANDDQTLNLSDVYPGTLEHVTDSEGNVVGLSGELGVRYGLMMFAAHGGKKYPLVNVEIDALDFEISKFTPLEGDSKMLLCLINQLIEDKKFIVVMNYIFGANKLTSLTAVYNDLAFIPSIGEVTVDDGEAYGTFSDIDTKPGSKIEIELDGDEIVSISETGKEGWASVDNRTPGFVSGLFVNEWDKWDRVLLRNSKKIIKKMFNTYYSHGFEFSPGNLGELPSPGQLIVSNMRNSLKPKPGLQLMPWWKLPSLRTNPFDSKGNICENE